MSFTSKEFWRRHAPDFNFELNEKQLVEKALEREFIRDAPGKGNFIYNPDYKPVTAEDIVVRDNGTDASEVVQDLVDEELYGEH